eukprot:362927-Chlamydomonas_euryale.AAC.9
MFRSLTDTSVFPGTTGLHAWLSYHSLDIHIPERKSAEPSRIPRGCKQSMLYVVQSTIRYREKRPAYSHVVPGACRAAHGATILRDHRPQPPRRCRGACVR